MKKICMVVQDPMVRGGICAVINGYRGSRLETDYQITYVESYKDGGRLVKLLKGIRSYCYFIRLILADRPELVHIHSSFGASFYRKLPFIYIAKWAGIPVINHIHGADFNHFYESAGNGKKVLVRKVYNKCDILIALSDEWKDRLAQIVSADRIMVIENYSISHKDALQQRIRRKNSHTILFLGELGKRKGCYDIPEVCKQVVKSVPDTMFILGGAGSRVEEESIRKLFQEPEIRNHVIFPGWVRGEEKDHLLRQADIFFLPSYNEGMPMSILDAMGYGLPIVSTRVGGIPKLVREGINGFCCGAGEIRELSAAIVKLLTDEELWKKTCKNSYKLVQEKYSLDAHIRLLEDLYDSLF